MFFLVSGEHWTVHIWERLLGPGAASHISMPAQMGRGLLKLNSQPVLCFALRRYAHASKWMRSLWTELNGWRRVQEHLCSISVSHKWLATSSQAHTGYFLKEWKFKTPEMCRVEMLDPEPPLFKCTSPVLKMQGCEHSTDVRISSVGITLTHQPFHKTSCIAALRNGINYLRSHGLPHS